MCEVGSLGNLPDEDPKLMVMQSRIPMKAKASKKGARNINLSPSRKLLFFLLGKVADSTFGV